MVSDMKGGVTHLQILSPHEAKNMLGIFMAMDGNSSTQMKYMREVAEKWLEKVRVGHLTRLDAWTALKTILMKTLEYPLLVLRLTETECTSIMDYILSGGLPNMRICRNIVRALVYAPVKHQGLGISKLHNPRAYPYKENNKSYMENKGKR